MMASIAVLMLDGASPGFADDAPLGGQDFCTSIPVIGVERTVFRRPTLL
jgi:hypothetical protein